MSATTTTSTTTTSTLIKSNDYNNNNIKTTLRHKNIETLKTVSAAVTENNNMNRHLLSKLRLNETNANTAAESNQTMISPTSRTEWNIDSSQFAKLTLNPVRKMIEQMRLEPNPELPMIALSIGDPTIFSDLGKPDTAYDAIEMCLKDKRFDGYTPSYGTETARSAVAKYCSRPDDLVYKSSDIILTNGCSHSLDLCITVLANRGQNILIPRPGFSIYKTLCHTLGIEVKYYTLIVSTLFVWWSLKKDMLLLKSLLIIIQKKDEKNWEADINEIESLVDEKTVAILINNPSNPCGSVYSRSHLIDLINLAERFKLPIIADEVYGDMVFPGNEFYYLSELSRTVPILSCNALSKRFILPGWRFGWIAIHDPINCMQSNLTLPFIYRVFFFSFFPVCNSV